MAFRIYQDDFNTSPTLEYIPATAGETFVPGEVLKVTAGKATKASGTEVPVFINQKVLPAAKAGEMLQVIRIQKNHRIAVPLQAVGTSLKIGDKVTIHTDGLQATATTSSGVLEIVEIKGTAVGDDIIVRV